MRKLVCLFVLLFPLAGLAGDSSALGSKILDCREIASSGDRLECYDRLGVPEISSPVSTDTPAVGAGPADQRSSALVPVSAVPAEFGFPVKNDEPKLMSAIVAGSVADSTGKLLITLSDGQVWKQSEKGRFPVKPGDDVVIRKGAFGSYVMTRDESNSNIHVKRVK